MTEMSGFDSTGPMELAVLEFADPAYDGSMASALSDLVERQIVAIVDLLILRKSSEGEVEVVELADAEGAVGDQFADLDGDVMWLLSDRDVAAVADHLEPGSTGVVVVWENVWARQMREAIARSGGRLVVHDRLDTEEVLSAMRDSSGG
ncbi:MAG TPA: DUF6325 family protein [Acidimicrobiia bacterium]|nr:DUF6325 family protein [Acidimicrobiia bacterium]